MYITATLKTFFTFIFLSAIKLDVFKCSSNMGMEGKVVGGNLARINQYPHAVFLEMVQPDRSAVICGSSIITQVVLITVAHCFESVDKRTKIIAYAGHEDIKKIKTVRRARRTLTHSNYVPSSAINDIALVLLNKGLPLASNMQRVIIRRRFSIAKGASMAGWGLVDEVNEGGDKLMSLTQKVRTQTQCSQLGLHSGMMCAGSTSQNMPRPAPGDSGSGLVNTNFELIGLLSFKLAKYPALPIYMNVSYYYNWIRKSFLHICA